MSNGDGLTRQVMTRPRFSKATLGAEIERRILSLQEEYEVKFNPNNGYAQVRGKGEEKNRAYGEFRALLDLAEHFDLMVGVAA